MGEFASVRGLGIEGGGKSGIGLLQQSVLLAPYSIYQGRSRTVNLDFLSSRSKEERVPYYCIRVCVCVCVAQWEGLKQAGLVKVALRESLPDCRETQQNGASDDAVLCRG